MDKSNFNNILSAVIIDDEKGAINVLSKLLERLGNVNILATEQNPHLGLRHIMVLKPDLVFLDVQMDRKSGITLLKEVKELSSQSEIIIVSGYDDYTYEAFKNGAADYLVKPILFSSLENAVTRIAQQKSEEETEQPKEQKKDEPQEVVQIRLAKDKGFLSAEEILYLKASGSYTEIYTLSGKCEICTRGLWLLERELPDSFFRIHRSTVVNTNFVKSVSERGLVCEVTTDNLSSQLIVSKANIEILEEMIANK